MSRIRKLDALGVGKFVDLPLHELGGCVRLIYRASGKIQFEKQVILPEDCRFAMGGSLMRVNPGRGVPKSTIPRPFEFYRTDSWARRIWTTLSVLTVLFAFALLARWRHLVIRRRRASAVC
jgi:hypothetical protein